MSAIFFIVVFAVIMGISQVQGETTTISLEQDETTIPSTLSSLMEAVTIPSQLQNNLPPELQNGEAKELISKTKRRCQKYGGEGAFEKFSSAGNEFGECISKLVNGTVLQKQVEAAKINGSVDEVFKKYCDQTPDFELCVKTGIETMKVCLSPEEQKQLKTVEVVAKELAKFICFKEGDRIALFIADGGQECIEQNVQELQRCANDTMAMSQYFGEDIIDRGFISFDEAHCKQISSFQICAVKVLGKCERPTTANIVDSLFKFAKRSTPCENYTVAQEPNAAANIIITNAALVIAVIATLFM